MQFDVAAVPGRQPGAPTEPSSLTRTRILRSGAVAAAARVAAAGGVRPGWSPRLGVVLGTGLGSLASRLDAAWSLSAAETGWLVPSTATGHAGRIVCGVIGGPGHPPDGRQPSGSVLPKRCGVVLLQGRAHGYEGHPPEILSRGVELLAALGVTTLLLTNAAGGLRPDMRVGELVVVRDHLDLVKRPWTQGLAVGGVMAAAEHAARATTATACYDPQLLGGSLDAARSVGALVRAGVYAHLTGPSYETRAEYRMLRHIGADVVGMSTVPEAIAAHRLGLRVGAVSVVTNVARPDAPACTLAEEVCRAAAEAAEGVWAILVRAAELTAAADASGYDADGGPP